MRVVHGWEPVLTGDDADRARTALDAIARALGPAAEGSDPAPAVVGEAPPPADATLADGLGGCALFFAALHEAHPGLGHDRTARRLLDGAIGASGGIADSPSLFSGITGVAWTMQRLASLCDPDALAALDEIDDAMRAALRGTPSPAGFDLIDGLVGIGVLALERMPRPAARETLERLVVWLEALAERTPDGLTWRARPEALHADARASFPAGCHYPGVAHGTAGVVGLLAGLLRAGIAPAGTRDLLDGAVRWLFAQELPGGRALFAHQSDGTTARPPARNAWCTGGPGIALMLSRAGSAAGRPEWQARAVALAVSAMRRPLAESGMRDACLCHGSAGLGLLSSRWYHATGDRRFRDDAVRWFRQTLDQRRPGEGVAGFSAMNAPRQRLEPAAGLLFGAAGIGLALLAATTGRDPAWDRVLLMSDPP
ncbi:MAG: lanthionine synthetase C family protein [Gemmatimonadetes bacterium]|nr:lanthionine synthetase C family protein [Gemmatimonadota bacterium]